MMDRTTKKKKILNLKRKERDGRTDESVRVKSKTLSDHLHATTLGKYPWNSVKKSA